MLLPHRFLDLDTCVLGVSASVISQLKRKHSMPYDRLLAAIKDVYGDVANHQLPLALDLLFLLGSIDYERGSDSITLLKTKVSKREA